MMRHSGSVPLVACAALSISAFAMGLAAGMDDYLPKPITFGSLRTVLLRWVWSSAEPEADTHPPGSRLQRAPQIGGRVGESIRRRKRACRQSALRNT